MVDSLNGAYQLVLYFEWGKNFPQRRSMDAIKDFTEIDEPDS